MALGIDKYSYTIGGGRSQRSEGGDDQMKRGSDSKALRLRRLRILQPLAVQQLP